MIPVLLQSLQRGVHKFWNLVEFIARLQPCTLFCKTHFADRLATLYFLRANLSTSLFRRRRCSSSEKRQGPAKMEKRKKKKVCLFVSTT